MRPTGKDCPGPGNRLWEWRKRQGLRRVQRVPGLAQAVVEVSHALTGDGHDVCMTCADTSAGQELMQRYPGMIMVSPTPIAINEFTGLGVLADWVVVAGYVPEAIQDTEDHDGDTTHADDFSELLVFVRDDNFVHSEDLDPDLQTLLIVRDSEYRCGMMGLTMHISAVLDIIAAGQISQVLASHGFQTYFDY